MGPDCGTSIIAGAGIGFANRVRRGAVGVVGASGTGIQEFTSLLHQAGGGVSHAIGTGGHDLADGVGGVTTLMGLDALEADAGTEIIVLISKPAGMKTLGLLQARIRRCHKPVIGCLLGLESALDGGSRFHQVRTIDSAVELALASSSGADVNLFKPQAGRAAQIEREVHGWLPEQRYLRGVFAGGTFCFQAQQVLHEGGVSVYSNTPLDARYRLANAEASLEHTVVDMGDDRFTQGKPHPMIDADERNKRIAHEANDAEMAILLLDFVLGDMASPDPVGDLLPAIQQAQALAAQRGGHLTVVASVCGTDRDPQDLSRQQNLLADAGVCVLPSSAMAAAFCLDLLRKSGGRNNG
jgi:succinyl-CoA synthetase alpha subunit